VSTRGPEEQTRKTKTQYAEEDRRTADPVQQRGGGGERRGFISTIITHIDRGRESLKGTEGQSDCFYVTSQLVYQTRIETGKGGYDAMSLVENANRT